MPRRNVDPDDYDSPEDYEEASKPNPKGGGGAPRAPIIYSDAVATYCDAYRFVQTPSYQTIFETIGDIRKYFAAQSQEFTDDGMQIVKKLLAHNGYFFRHIPGFSEPVLTVELREIEQLVPIEDNILVSMTDADNQ